MGVRERQCAFSWLEGAGSDLASWEMRCALMLFYTDPASSCWADFKEQGCVNLACSTVPGSPFGLSWVPRRGCAWAEGTNSGCVESENENENGWVNASDKRRPLALSRERTGWPLVSPQGTGVAKGKSCFGSDPCRFVFSLVLGPKSLEHWSVERNRCKALNSNSAEAL